MTREEAKNVLINCTVFIKDCFWCMKKEHQEQFKEAYKIAIESLDNQTSNADKTVAKWIDDRENFGISYCSNCGKIPPNEYVDEFNYCPFCGAKMR